MLHLSGNNVRVQNLTRCSPGLILSNKIGLSHKFHWEEEFSALHWMYQPPCIGTRSWATWKNIDGALPTSYVVPIWSWCIQTTVVLQAGTKNSSLPSLHFRAQQISLGRFLPIYSKRTSLHFSNYLFVGFFFPLLCNLKFSKSESSYSTTG